MAALHKDTNISYGLLIHGFHCRQLYIERIRLSSLANMSGREKPLNRANLHFSQETCCNGNNNPACCVTLPHSPQRTASTPPVPSVACLASRVIFTIPRRFLVRNAG
jgi:hypothetical protein